MADGKTKRRPRSGLDTIIAANGGIVATGNEHGFVDVETINPTSRTIRRPSSRRRAVRVHAVTAVECLLVAG
jgi:hypothetical protein